ncbi:MAG TPA: serine hydrolase domain-containing protein [Methylomirabilota bacterium]|nr:serine hydrolase domain-containing protein [Methylomirabilota bacterium]
MAKTRRLLSAAVTAAVIMIGAGVHAQGAKPAPKDEILGMSREGLARIAPVMKEQVEKGVFPGAVTLVARRATIVHYEAHGFLDAAKTKPMTKDAIFRLASMTKPIVTVAAMMLVEQGVIKLNDPISTWLPELKDMKVETQKTDKDGKAATEDVPVNRPIMVHDLMRHTAGFVYAGSTKSPRIKEMYEKANIEAREADITGDEMLKGLGQIPLAHQPGTFWEYSIAVDVLGLLVERATKKPLDQLLTEMLFEPLGMKATAFWVPKEKVARLADALDADPQKVGLNKSYRIFENPAGKSYFKGGAGLVGTANDYLKFAQMVVNGGEYQGKRYLSKKMVEFMLSDHTVGMGGSTIGTTGPGYGFGLGFAVRLHDGFAWVPGSKGDAMWAGAWGTSFWIDPKEGLVSILMAQSPSNRIRWCPA